MKYRFFLNILFVFLSFNVVYAQQSKEEAFEKFKEKYGNLKSLSVQFKMPDNPSVTGQLKAKTGNKYLLQIAGRIVICNGSSIWNYSKDENTVTISEFDSHSDEMSIEDFFFSFIKTAKPVSFGKDNSSSGTNGWFLKLESEKKKKKDILKDLKIVFQPDSYKILLLQANTTSGIHTWKIEHFQSNPNLSDSMFEFKEPKNCKVIDLR